MLYVAGIDIGSTYSKAIVLNERREVVGTAVRRTGFKLALAAEAVFAELLAGSNVDRAAIAYVAATGYGRYTVPFRNTQITELTAHAQAAVHLFPDTRTILDIGGQDIKAIKVDAEGRVKIFRLNDKCAAGTGAFLEKTARYLGLTTADLGPYALRATKPVPISSVCAVFAESEVISHLSKGVAAEDIVMGAMESLGGRAIQLMRRVEKLLSEGKPIPPTAAQQAPSANAAVRRWSAMVPKKRVEPCRATGICPVVMEATAKPLETAA